MKNIFNFLKNALSETQERRKSVLVFAIDMSASMIGTEKDMMESYNSYVRHRSAVSPDTAVITFLFNHEVTCVCEGKNIGIVPKLYYSPGNATAMYDGFGEAIEYTTRWVRDNEAYADAPILYVFKTDGYENSSKHYDAEDIRYKIQDTDKSSFIILSEFCVNGTELAQQLGLSVDNVQLFFRDQAGIECIFKAIDIALSIIEEKGSLEGIHGSEWKEQSNKIQYGRMTLGEIDTKTVELRETLDQNEKDIARFEKIALEEGLTPQFEADYAAFMANLDRLYEMKQRFKGMLCESLAEAGFKRQIQDGRRIMKYALNQEIKQRVAENEAHARDFEAFKVPAADPRQFEALCQKYRNGVSDIAQVTDDAMQTYKFMNASNKTRTAAILRTQNNRYQNALSEVLDAQTHHIQHLLSEANMFLFGSAQPNDPDVKRAALNAKIVSALTDVVQPIRTLQTANAFWAHCANNMGSQLKQLVAFEAFYREYARIPRWFESLDTDLKQCGINGTAELLRY